MGIKQVSSAAPVDFPSQTDLSVLYVYNFGTITATAAFPVGAGGADPGAEIILGVIGLISS